MKRVLRILVRGLIVVIVLAIALFGYFVYSPFPEVPRLSGQLTEGTVQVGALKRTYTTYGPRDWQKERRSSWYCTASIKTARKDDGGRVTGSTAWPTNMDLWLRIPMDTRLLECVQYRRSYSANKLNIDDVGFLTAIVDKLVNELGIDPGRVLRPEFPAAAIWRFVLCLRPLPAERCGDIMASRLCSVPR